MGNKEQKNPSDFIRPGICNPQTGEIIEGQDHQTVYNEIPEKKRKSFVEGFVAKGKFITREEALKYYENTLSILDNAEYWHLSLLGPLMCDEFRPEKNPKIDDWITHLKPKEYLKIKKSKTL